MKTKRKIKIMTPYEVPHYFFKFLTLKKKNESMAVKMAVKSLYPGHSEICTDYISSKKGTLAFSINKELLEEYNKSNVFIFTAPQLIQKKIKNADCLCIFDDCILFQSLKNKKITFLKIYDRNENVFSLIKEDFSERNEEVKITHIFNASAKVCSFLNDYAAKNHIKIDELFSLLPKRLNKIKRLFFIKKKSLIPSLIFLLFSLISLFLISYKASVKKIKYDSIKKDFIQNSRLYDSLSSTDFDLKERQETSLNNIKNIVSAGEILFELQNLDKSLELTSFNLSENLLNFEGISCSTVFLLEVMKKSDLFTSVNLKNVIPFNNKEKFIMEVKINNGDL